MPKFNVHFSDSAYQDLADMSDQLDQPMAEVIREALSMYRWLIKETAQGSTLLVQRDHDRPPQELLVPYLDRLRDHAERQRVSGSGRGKPAPTQRAAGRAGRGATASQP